ncbi:protein PHYTOCHROME KINASE SUBSTRATE 4 [Amborella trichopoda]|uniref:Uncharacterized protein n=1 Tax=Amborella trichopoda TaxID=13333 RepID=W1NR01_AMBTC|nr:protein PHYTOCHROME KINASE SUBSTRATE 4 [Amborella trichopoda]ERM97259.1 hypothetical protein AMTR_s00119p00112700 [Amborella trichopoda]|eukprot:XP_006829843.1 protein PHYTOCHROME KINASE SUBSTRATE 4 [Amborella trichopoda]
MERYTVSASLNGEFPFSQSTTHLRDASFSSYISNPPDPKLHISPNNLSLENPLSEFSQIPKLTISSNISLENPVNESSQTPKLTINSNNLSLQNPPNEFFSKPKLTIQPNSFSLEDPHSEFSQNPKLINNPNNLTLENPIPASLRKPGNVGRTRTNYSEISIFDAEKYFNGTSLERIPEKGLVSELSRPKTNGENLNFSIPRDSSASSADGFSRNYRSVSFHATPTSSSEASWNSQSGLLCNPPGSISVTVRNLPVKPQRKGASKWSFSCRCPCYGKKSVGVRERKSETRNEASSMAASTEGSPSSSRKTLGPNENSNSHASEREKSQASETEMSHASEREMTQARGRETKVVAGKVKPAGNWEAQSPEIHFRAEIGRRKMNPDAGFSFPILNPMAGKFAGKPNGLPEKRIDDKPRDSIEVFQPSKELHGPPEFRISGEGLRRSFGFPARGLLDNERDDAGSDSSSDLFEIESFSTGITSSLYNMRDSLDELSSCTGSEFPARRLPTNPNASFFRQGPHEEAVTPSALSDCYEPSEASVEWSVTTAEGFDRGSISNFTVDGLERVSIGNFSAAPTECGDPKVFGVRGYSDTRAIGASHKSKNKSKSGLLWCKCEKAVNVVPQPIKGGPDRAHLDRGMGLVRVQEVCITDPSAHVNGIMDRRMLARSPSEHFSRALATH